MSLQSIVSVIEKVSPVLSNVLVSNSPIAKIALSMLSAVFNSSTDTDDILSRMTVDPDLSVKIKSVDLSMRELSSKDYQAYTSDLQDARSKNGTQKDWIVHFLASTFMVYFCCYVSTSIFSPQHFDRGIFHDLLNVLMLIFAYYFSSSYIQSKQQK